MLRQAAFIAKNKMLKGALHCHTTRSDGSGTPEEVLRMHREHSYDFVSLTDHRIYNYENFAPETGLTIIPGMEIDANFAGKGIHCFHEVVIGPEKENGNGFAQDQRFDSMWVNGCEDFQPVLDEMHANGNLTIYCHPEWSCTPVHEFAPLRGNIAFEIWNSGCVVLCDQDANNGFIWDSLLTSGQKIWAVATDDGHGMAEHCLGWVMVNAKNDVSSILRALKDGAFYASTGPEIYDFRIENGQAVVECSECAQVSFFCGHWSQLYKNEDGGAMTKAWCDLDANVPYVRASVVDKQGRRAWTNPIFLDR